MINVIWLVRIIFLFEVISINFITRLPQVASSYCGTIAILSFFIYISLLNPPSFAAKYRETIVTALWNNAPFCRTAVVCNFFFSTCRMTKRERVSQIKQSNGNCAFSFLSFLEFSLPYYLIIFGLPWPSSLDMDDRRI